ncbi:6,7-dimethyl-8-ribityllumazine synthase [Terrihabitans soli]|uniref:6,7-dimethyl-8-ribityllumazine synthase n=1 Tax=Terrihabitans soli TaxID=708113 RepID=A0A6S6QVU8_9HYPH|nr:6,7-dimethyl-8-ribityllumazine synthase [Terrihabitans soli]BCJ90628.1 6,7-dimethyl-8-ribityllumazine synthase [Terrihabitans soli]
MAAPQRKDKAEEPVRAHILIVEARFYDALADELLKGAVARLKAAGATYTKITVPGALEIPGTAAIALDIAEDEDAPFDGVVGLGCIIRGETYHFEIVANESSRGLMDLSVKRSLPVGNGILTVENEEQAWERAKTDKGDKGGGAVEAVLTVIRQTRAFAKSLES